MKPAPIESREISLRALDRYRFKPNPININVHIGQTIFQKKSGCSFFWILFIEKMCNIKICVSPSKILVKKWMGEHILSHTFCPPSRSYPNRKKTAPRMSQPNHTILIMPMFGPYLSWYWSDFDETCTHRRLSFMAFAIFVCACGFPIFIFGPFFHIGLQLDWSESVPKFQKLREGRMRSETIILFLFIYSFYVCTQWSPGAVNIACFLPVIEERVLRDTIISNIRCMAFTPRPTVRYKKTPLVA